MRLPRLTLARGLLAFVALYAVARLADPEQRWARYRVGGDRVEHAVVVYLLMVLIPAAAPELPLWAPAAGLIGLGVAVEMLQALPWIVGDFQLGDIAADVAGVALGAFALCMARRRIRS